jgi:hypothetical protein
MARRSQAPSELDTLLRRSSPAVSGQEQVELAQRDLTQLLFVYTKASNGNAIETGPPAGDI